MITYFPPYGSSGKNIKVELDLSNSATKQYIKDITHVDTSSFASKTNLASLKSEVDKIDTDKLITVPDDLVKLSNVVKMILLKRLSLTNLKIKLMRLKMIFLILLIWQQNQVLLI